jgi:hypothetical protein
VSRPVNSKSPKFNSLENFLKCLAFTAMPKEAQLAGQQRNVARAALQETEAVECYGLKRRYGLKGHAEAG